MRAVLLGRGPEPGSEPSATQAGPNPLAEPWRIGDLEMPNRVVQAPLAGIANRAFRVQSQRHGAGLAVSEMVSAYGIQYENARTIDMLRRDGAETISGIQVFGANPEVMAQAARAIEAAGADLIDINMGCPVRKVCSTGAGAALLAEPGQAEAVIGAMVRAVNIPVTVRMRRGLTPATSNPVELARRFEAAGAAALCVHPRAAAEEYEGTADHRITAEVVAAVSIPVIASGDVVSPEGARAVLDQTGADAIAIGRAALGYPWVFGDLLQGVARPRPQLAQVVAEVEGFARAVAPVLGTGRACGYMRKFYSWYLAGYDLPPGLLEALVREPELDGALSMLSDAVGAGLPA